MNTPPTAPSLDHLKALTLQRLMALAWLADIAEGIVILLRRGLAVSALAAAYGPRLRRMLERVRRALRVIEALDLRLRETLRLIEAGVRPPPEAASKAASGSVADGEVAEIEASERPEAPDWRERPERFSFLSPALPRLTGSVDDIVARIIDDLGVLPAWRRLAEAVWRGEDPAPDAVGRVLAEAFLEAMPLRRPAPTTGRATSRSAGASSLATDLASGPPRHALTPAPA